MFGRLSTTMIVVCLGGGAGCAGNEFEGTDRPTDETSPTDETPDASVVIIADTSRCVPAQTCQGKVAEGRKEDCIADFGLGTNQAGYPDDGYNTYIGLYGYKDQTKGGIISPPRNDEDSEPAAEITSCDTGNNYAIHFTATGFTDWGAGIGLDWGGPLNESCDVEGALECYEVYLENEKFSLANAEADPRCQGGNVDAKLDCLKRGLNVKTPKDLSAYVGIGFWVLAAEGNEAASLKVTFPIPETVRFYGGANGCSDDDGDPSTNCFNDFYTTVNLNPNDKGVWVYKSVYFDDIAWSEWWGLQLGEIGIDAFPPDQSMGIKFQVDAVDGVFRSPDLYFDDIILLRE